MDRQSLKEDRLKLLKKSATKLKQKKREGLDLSKKYKAGEVVFSKGHDLFGRITSVTETRMMIDFGTEKRGFTRRYKEEKKVAAPSFGRTAEETETVTDAELDDNRIKWDDEKDEFIRDNIDKSNQWLAKELGTTVASVKGRTHRLKSTGFIDSKQRRNFVWTEENDQFLLEHLEESNKWLAEELGTTVGSVKGRIRRLRDRGVITRGDRTAKK